MLPLIVGVAMANPLSELEWNVVNDTVMGGVSSGRTKPLNTGLVQFEGELSLDNNGGFVSLRTTPAELGLDGASGLRVKVRGDGRTWNINAYRGDVRMRAGSYRTVIQTLPGEVTEHTVAFADFEPTSFGRPVPGAPALDAHPERIDQLGFLLGDKKPGSFTLEVVSIEPVREMRSRSEGIGDVHGRLAEALQVGVPAFNAGDPARCRDTYRDVLMRIGDHPALTEGEQRIVGDALDTAGKQPATDGAWTLRAAIDTVLATRP